MCTFAPPDVGSVLMSVTELVNVEARWHQGILKRSKKEEEEEEEESSHRLGSLDPAGDTRAYGGTGRGPGVRVEI